jgi:ureidoacrylate peracid hydrolase
MVDEVIPRIQELMTLFRHKQMEVIHVRVAEWTKDSRDVGWKQLVRGLIVPSDSKEAEPLVEVGPIDDELIVSKSSSGVFATTNFDRLLRNMGIDTLIFTGTATGGCVESAVRDAVDMGYDVIVVEDACADSTRPSHALAISRMDNGLCRIYSTDQLVEIFTVVEDGDKLVRSGLERVKEYLPTPPTEPPGPDVNPYSLIFPPAIQLPINLHNTALVIQDAIAYACDPNVGLGALAQEAKGEEIAAYYARVNAALPKIAMLLTEARALGMRVIHIRTAGQLPDGGDLSPHLREQGITIALGTPAADFVAGLTPMAGEVVINKPGVGAFTGTGIDDLLRHMAVEHVILTGVSFVGGLESSLRSFTDRGYGAVVVPDAWAAYHPLLQEKASTMQSGIIRVMERAEVTRYLRALAVPA